MHAVRNPKTKQIETYGMAANTVVCLVCGEEVRNRQPFYGLGEPYNCLVHNHCFALVEWDGQTRMQTDIQQRARLRNQEAVDTVSEFLRKPYGRSRVPAVVQKAIHRLMTGHCVPDDAQEHSRYDNANLGTFAPAEAADP